MELTNGMQKPMTDYEEFKLPDSSFLNLKSEAQKEAKQQVESTRQTAENTKQQIHKTEELINLATKAEQRAIDAEGEAKKALRRSRIANFIAFTSLLVAAEPYISKLVLNIFKLTGAAE